MIRIDGSYGEGGGQILRTALSLSTCLRTPFEIVNIRKGRPRAGLLPQHLTSVNAVAKICNAEVSGAKFGSTSLIFNPNEIIAGDYEFNVAEKQGSAGAITLIAQAILPILISTKSRIILKGGTHVLGAPIYDYLDKVLIGYLNQNTKSVDAKLIQYGFFPVGRGKIELTFNGKYNLNNLSSLLNRGFLKKLSLTSRVAELPIAIAERQRNHFTKILENDFPQTQIETHIERVQAACPGTYLFLKAEFENITVGFSTLGERGKPAETVATETYQEYKTYLLAKDSVFDYHLADQICIFLALHRFRKGNQGEPFTIKTNKMTNHLQTNIWLIQQFIPGFQPIVQVSAGS
ncbi:MAG: RNA 3'-phosphate cyclase [Ignavibacteria bacterium]|nr:RNA 3'-phosphate cyclase [Ignavibacteria bacterium]